MQTIMYEGIVTRICIACAVNIVQIVIALTLYISIFLVFNQKALYESTRKLAGLIAVKKLTVSVYNNDSQNLIFIPNRLIRTM